MDDENMKNENPRLDLGLLSSHNRSKRQNVILTENPTPLGDAPMERPQIKRWKKIIKKWRRKNWGQEKQTKNNVANNVDITQVTNNWSTGC